MLRTIALATALLVALSGCTVEGEHVDNQPAELSVRLIMNVDGCSVYRFRDNSDYHYLTTCPGSVTSPVDCGKNCTRSETTPTVIRPDQ